MNQVILNLQSETGILPMINQTRFIAQDTRSCIAKIIKI